MIVQAPYMTFCWSYVWFKLCLQIIFKNMASRPFNIYPNGLTKIFPLQRSTNGKIYHRHEPTSYNIFITFVCRLSCSLLVLFPFCFLLLQHPNITIRSNFLLSNSCRERLALHGSGPQWDVWLHMEANNRWWALGGRPPVSDPAVSEHHLTRERLGIGAGGHPAHLQVWCHRHQRTPGENA